MSAGLNIGGGVANSGSGAYVQSGGLLSESFNEIIGGFFSGSGSFVQSGGTHTISAG